LKDARRRARKISDDVSLWEYGDTQCLKAVGGMGRLVLLTMASRLEDIFLDKPTSGLDQ